MKQFRESSIRRVYDSLHGISAQAIPLSNAVEIMAYCLVDGKVDQESGFETNLYNDLVSSLKKLKAGFYSLKTCDAFGILSCPWIPGSQFKNTDRFGGSWIPCFSIKNADRFGCPWIPAFQL